MTIRQDVFNALQERGQATAKSLAIALNLKHSQAREALGKMVPLGLVVRDGHTWHAMWRCVPGAKSPDDRRGLNPNSAAGRKLGPGSARRLGIIGRANCDPFELDGMSNTDRQNYCIKKGLRIASKQRAPKHDDCALWNILRGPLGKAPEDDLGYLCPPCTPVRNVIPKEQRAHYKKFRAQKSHAKQRGIGWELTFEQWLDWWGADIDKRGVGPDSLQMQRFKDAGPYALGNIRKGTPKVNHKTRVCMARNRGELYSGFVVGIGRSKNDDGSPDGYTNPWDFILP